MCDKKAGSTLTLRVAKGTVSCVPYSAAEEVDGRGLREIGLDLVDIIAGSDGEPALGCLGRVVECVTSVQVRTADDRREIALMAVRRAMEEWRERLNRSMACRKNDDSKAGGDIFEREVLVEEDHREDTKKE